MLIVLWFSVLLCSLSFAVGVCGCLLLDVFVFTLVGSWCLLYELHCFAFDCCFVLLFVVYEFVGCGLLSLCLGMTCSCLLTCGFVC